MSGVPIPARASPTFTGGKFVGMCMMATGMSAIRKDLPEGLAPCAAFPPGPARAEARKDQEGA